MADGVAQPFVDTHEALDRFARRKLGVGAQALMKAWAFPHAQDLEATRIAFAHVKPYEPAVAERVKQMSAAWEARFQEDDDDE